MPKNRGWVLGITGRIGSGKSTAAKAIVDSTGAKLIDLDKTGHQVLTDPDMIRALTSALGNTILDNDRKIDRKALGRLVFSDPKALSLLNKLSHPKIQQQVEQQVANNQAQSIVIVGALIDKMGLRSICDKILVIDADDSLLSERTGDRWQIANFQPSRKHYQERADHIIQNTFLPSFFEAITTFIIKDLPK